MARCVNCKHIVDINSKLCQKCGISGDDYIVYWRNYNWNIGALEFHWGWTILEEKPFFNVKIGTIKNIHILNLLDNLLDRLYRTTPNKLNMKLVHWIVEHTP